MFRQNQGPAAPIKPLVTAIARTSQGGTSGSTPSEAARNLMAVTIDQVGQPNGFALRGEDGVYPRNCFAALDKGESVGAFSVYGPTLVARGSTAKYEITNYDSLTPCTVTVSAGTLVQAGAILTFTAPVTGDTVTMTIEGRLVTITLTGALVYPPAIAFPVNGASGISKTVTLKSSRYGTLPPIVGSSVVATTGTVQIDPTAYGVILTGSSSGKLPVSVVINGETLYFPEGSSKRTAIFDFGTDITTMAVDLGTAGSLSYQWLMASTAHSSTDWQIATDSAFTAIVNQLLDSATNKTSYTVDLDYGKAYYARVRYRSSYGTSDWSAPSRLVTQAKGYPAAEYAKIEGADTHWNILNSTWRVVPGFLQHALSGDGLTYISVDRQYPSYLVQVFKKNSTAGWDLIQTLGIPVSDSGMNESLPRVSLTNDGKRFIVSMRGNDTFGHDTWIQIFDRQASGLYQDNATNNATSKGVATVSGDGNYIAFTNSVTEEWGARETEVTIKAYPYGTWGNQKPSVMFTLMNTTAPVLHIELSYSGDRVFLFTGDYIWIYRRTSASPLVYEFEYRHPGSFTQNDRSNASMPAFAKNSGDRFAFERNNVVSIYKRTGVAWGLEANIAMSDTSASTIDGISRSGKRLEMNGDGSTLILGNPYSQKNGSNAGAAYVFTLKDGVWGERRELKPQTAGYTANDRFGAIVGITTSGDEGLVVSYSMDNIGDIAQPTYRHKTMMYKVGAIYTVTLQVTTGGTIYVPVPDGAVSYDVTYIAPGGGGGTATDPGNNTTAATGGGSGGWGNSVGDILPTALTFTVENGYGGQADTDGGNTSLTYNGAKVTAYGGKRGNGSTRGYAVGLGGLAGPGGEAGRNGPPLTSANGSYGASSYYTDLFAIASAGYPGILGGNVNGQPGAYGGGGGGASGSHNSGIMGTGGKGGDGVTVMSFKFYDPVIAKEFETAGSYKYTVPSDGSVRWLDYDLVGGGGGGGGGGANQGYPNDSLRQGLNGGNGTPTSIYKNGVLVATTTAGAGGPGNVPGWSSPTPGSASVYTGSTPIIASGASYSSYRSGDGIRGSGGAGGWYCTRYGSNRYSGYGGTNGGNKKGRIAVSPGDIIDVVVGVGGASGAGSFERMYSFYGFDNGSFSSGQSGGRGGSGYALLLFR